PVKANEPPAPAAGQKLNHSQFWADDRPSVGTPRPIAGSSGGDVIRAGHSEPPPTSAPSADPWRKPEPRESRSPDPQPSPGEKALPRTAAVPIGDWQASPSAAAAPPQPQPKTQRYDVTIYRAQADDTWERMSAKHYGHERYADAL